MTREEAIAYLIETRDACLYWAEPESGIMEQQTAAECREMAAEFEQVIDALK